MSNSTEQVGNRSRELFRQNYCCAESVLMALAESCGIKSGIIPAIATGLCGGIGRTGCTCGAVTGGVLGLNLVFGRTSPTESPEQNHRVVAAFIKEFENQFGNLGCERLIGCRLDTPEGHQSFVEKKLRAEKCEVFVQSAARIASELIVKQTGSDCGCGCNR